jgi:hypothetical protein
VGVLAQPGRALQEVPVVHTPQSLAPAYLENGRRRRAAPRSRPTAIVRTVQQCLERSERV